MDWYDGGRVIEAMERAQDLGVPVFLNLESRYCDAPNLSDLLRFTNVCQVSMDEPQASGNPPDIARDLLAEGVDAALVTLGAEGCMVAQGSQLFHIRPLKVEVIDGDHPGPHFEHQLQNTVMGQHSEVHNLKPIGYFRVKSFGQADVLFHRIDAIGFVSPGVK